MHMYCYIMLEYFLNSSMCRIKKKEEKPCVCVHESNNKTKKNEREKKKKKNQLVSSACRARKVIRVCIWYA